MLAVSFETNDSKIKLNSLGSRLKTPSKLKPTF